LYYNWQKELPQAPYLAEVCCHSTGQQEQCATQEPSNVLEIRDEVNTGRGVETSKGAVNKTLIIADTLPNIFISCVL